MARQEPRHPEAWNLKSVSEGDAVADETPRPPYALRVVIDGRERMVTYEELALSNNLAQEALVRLLVRKKLIDPKELMEEISAVKTERYRVEPPGGKPAV